VHNVPDRGQTLTSAFARLMHSTDAPSIGRDTLLEILSYDLAETLLRDSYDDDISKVYGPKNKFLLDSLLSGFSFKYGLTSSPDMYGYISEGFKAPHSSKDTELELSVVGTCIQLLLCGSRIRHGRWGGNVAVAKKLKAHEAAGTVKDLHAIEVLKVLFLYMFKLRIRTNMI
jgi:hypothetical protein